MNNLTITTRRADILRAIADPNIEVYASLGDFRNTHWPSADVWLKTPDGMTWKVTKVVADLEAAGLVTREAQHARFRQPRHYTLTKAGEKALADYDENGQQ